MPLASVPFLIQRVTLQAAILTEVIAPLTCQSLTIGNATTGDLRLATDASGADYLVIASGFERVIWLPQPTSGQFHRQQIACWLQADDAGTVVLTWA